MSFAAEAARLAGMAGAVLGWPPDRFWRATPTELHAVVTAMMGVRQGAGCGEGEPPSPATLARLREMYPDG